MAKHWGSQRSRNRQPVDDHLPPTQLDRDQLRESNLKVIRNAAADGLILFFKWMGVALVLSILFAVGVMVLVMIMVAGG